MAKFKPNGRSQNRSKGRVSEQYACEYLIDLGYKILDTNWHFSNYGELDIIAEDPGRNGKNYLVFIEVKSRSHSLALSMKALSHHKIMRLQRLAQAYMKYRKYNEHATNISFDLIAINHGKLCHLKNII